MTSLASAPLSHEEIISRLRGQTLHVPDLTCLFAHWPAPTKNEHYAALQSTVHEAVTTVAAKHPASKRRLDDDIALLTSLGYAHAGLDELRILGLYLVWLICWDDEVDANEGDMAGDFSEAEAWRTDTLKVLNEALGVSSTDMNKRGKDPLHDMLFDVGKALQDRYTLQQRQHVCDKLTLFIQNCATEQKLRLEGKIPSYEDYMSMRIETVAGGTLCSLIEYSRGISLPTACTTSNSRDELDKQVSVLLSLLNDVLSLKKELKTDCVINAVATLMTATRSLDDVVAEVVTKMKQAVSSFDAAAAELESCATSEAERTDALKYIDGCKALVTGTLEFTWVFHYAAKTPSNRMLRVQTRNY